MPHKGVRISSQEGMKGKDGEVNVIYVLPMFPRVIHALLFNILLFLTF